MRARGGGGQPVTEQGHATGDSGSLADGDDYETMLTRRGGYILLKFGVFKSELASGVMKRELWSHSLYR
jgi:hypothetical protein